MPFVFVEFIVMIFVQEPIKSNKEAGGKNDNENVILKKPSVMFHALKS